jgi:hypothetical protein
LRSPIHRFGSAFIIGEILVDPGGFPAVLLSASWFVPMVALTVIALRRPEMATTVLTVVTAVVASFVVLDGVFGIVPRDEIEPVASIGVFAVAVPLGFVGLHRPLRAGWLLLLVGAANLAEVFVKMLGAGGGPSLDAALGGTSGAVAVPVVIIGGLSSPPRPWSAAGPRKVPRWGPGPLGPVNPHGTHGLRPTSAEPRESSDGVP